MLRLLAYGLMCAMFLASLYFDVTSIPNFQSDTWFGRLVYLTMLNFLLDNIYYTLAFVNEIHAKFSKKSAKRSLLKRYLDFTYATLTFPVGFAVVIIFWVLYNIDRDLVFPEALDKWFPHWYNHVLHTAPVICTLIDTYLTKHEMPSQSTGLKTVLFFSIGYNVNMLLVYYRSGRWLYGIMEFLDFQGKALFLVGCSLFVLALYGFGRVANYFVWASGSNVQPKLTAQAKRKGAKHH